MPNAKININDLNYIAVFLSLRCNLKCSYCINHSSGLEKKQHEISGQQWLNFFQNNNISNNIPVTLQGGEPTLHRDFYKIVNDISHPIDLLTNLQFDLEKFIDNTSPQKFARDLPYPSIRVSLHPSFMNLDKTYSNVKILHQKGYSIGVYIVEHPEADAVIKHYRSKAKNDGIVFKTKPFLGYIENNKYGTYLYDDAYSRKSIASCMCKTTELLCSPQGLIYRCHHDLYNKFNSTGNIFDNKTLNSKYQECHHYGSCNPCDVKIKNNRFQEFGHASVSIQSISYKNKKNSSLSL